MPDPDDIMTIAEVEAFTHIKCNNLAQLRYRDEGPKYLNSTPKTILYRRQWVVEWLEASERRGAAASAQ